MAEKLATNSTVAPDAIFPDAVPIPYPATHNGGTRAMPTAVPAAAAVVSAVRRTVV